MADDAFKLIYTYGVKFKVACCPLRRSFSEIRITSDDLKTLGLIRISLLPGN